MGIELIPKSCEGIRDLVKLCHKIIKKDLTGFDCLKSSNLCQRMGQSCHRRQILIENPQKKSCIYSNSAFIHVAKPKKTN